MNARESRSFTRAVSNDTLMAPLTAITSYTWRRPRRANRAGSTIGSIADWVPKDAEAGVGLALQDDSGRYLFFLAGTRHHCPPGELFYAGIGGHLEAGEDWLACAHRETKEEIGTDVEILASPVTWHISQRGSVQQIEVMDQPRPLAFYEMIHPPEAPRAGELYRIVIYKARLRDMPKELPADELLGVIALTAEQVARGPERRPTLDELVEEGSSVITNKKMVDRGVRLYPFGTAMALAHILRHEGKSGMARRALHGLLFFGASALLVLVWLLFFLRLHDPAFPPLVCAGWAVMAGGLVLIVLAMRTLGTQGRLQPGQDFTHTTRVVEHGIYAVVRHPLYLGWLLMYVAAMLFSQHWLVLILALLGSGCLYGIARLEDRDLIERFGPAYERYMRAVPRMNLVAGILRVLRKRRPE